MDINETLFNEARNAWQAGNSFRAARRRLMRNTYGDQWSNYITTSDGRNITEYERAVGAGMTPMTNNLLRALVKTVVGRFRYNISRDDSSSLPDSFLRFKAGNRLDELDARMLEEFLISGCAVQKVICERRPAGLGIWVDNVNPDNFFVNRFLDPRGNDIRIIGTIADMPLDEIRLRFSHGSRSRNAEIGKIYSETAGGSLLSPGISLGESTAQLSFLRPSDPELCRVIEVWSFDIDSSSPASDPHWHCRFFSPTGVLLDHTRTYFPGGSHPFAVKFYPLTGGSVHPFIEDLVEQQKHINMLVTTIDHVLATSAKGVLLFPTDCLAPGVDITMAAEMWGKPGGVLPVNPNARNMPAEVSSSGRSEGAAKLLDLEMKMFESISGVTSALQGRVDGSGTSASLYESQVYHSAIALLDVYETFNSFRNDRNCLANDLINIISQ